MSDLDACPHCGQAGFARVKRWPWEKEGEPGLVWGFHVICDASGIDTHPRGCGASSGWGETPEEAIAAWNRRAAPQPSAPEGRPTHRHKKRGTEYVLIGYGRMQAEDWWKGAVLPDMSGSDLEQVDMREVAIYRSVDDGSLWVRPREEFEDGRFEAIPPAPTTEEPVDDLQSKIDTAKVKVGAMSPEEREAMYRAQRESFARGMSPCEHGVADWEDCQDCRARAIRTKGE